MNVNVIEIKRIRDKTLKAYEDALEAKSLGMNGRNLSRQDLDALKKEFVYWDRCWKNARSRGKRKPYSLVNFTGY